MNTTRDKNPKMLDQNDPLNEAIAKVEVREAEDIEADRQRAMTEAITIIETRGLDFHEGRSLELLLSSTTNAEERIQELAQAQWYLHRRQLLLKRQ